MKKRKLLALVPVVFIAAASTAASAYENCPFNGFYTGLGIGESNTLGRSTSTQGAGITVPGGTAASASSTAYAGLKKQSFAGAIFAGYGMAWDCLYLGAEAAFKGAKARAGNKEVFSATQAGLPGQSITISERTRARLRTGEFDLDLRPGVMLSPSSLLYVKVGAAINRLSLCTVRSLNVANSTFTQTIHKKKNVVGLRLGAGLEQNFCDCWSVRADYTYAHFKKVHVSATQTAGLNTSAGRGTLSATGKASARLSSHTVMMGLSYYW